LVRKNLVVGIVFLFIISSIVPVVISYDESGTSICPIHPFNGSNTSYYTYDQLTVLIAQLQDDHPDIFLYYSCGKTYEGRDIWVVKISDNVTNDEDEPEILYMSGVHGNEKPGYQTIIYSLKTIAENYTKPNVNHSLTTRIRNIVNTTELYFIPMVNPDGVEAATRKNREPNDCVAGDTLFCGVDVNRNFAYKWDELDVYPFKYVFGGFPKIPFRTTVKYSFLDIQSLIKKGSYRGPYPFSENESKLIKQFIENHSIVLSVDYHTYGEKVLYPWSWTRDPPSDENIFKSIGDNISKINGYDVIQASTWYYVPGSSGDWLYAEYNIYSFTIELCASNFLVYFPIKNIIENLCKTHLEVNLYIAEQTLLM